MMMFVSPVMGAPSDDDIAAGEVTNAITSLVDPVAGLAEVLASPAGAPLKKVLNLLIGICLLYTVFALFKDYTNGLSDNSEKSSSGFVNMGKHTVGLLVLFVCLGFLGYFMNFQL